MGIWVRPGGGREAPPLTVRSGSRAQRGPGRNEATVETGTGRL